MKRHPEALTLLREIEAFLQQKQMTQTEFGLLAMRDGNFISRLRGGRTPTLVTLDRVRRFIKRYAENVAQPSQ